MCTAAFDELGAPFTCALADGRPLHMSLPPAAAHRGRTAKAVAAARALTWRDVAAGMMLNNGVLREGHAGGRAGLERELLLRAARSWMPQAAGLDLLLMASCGGDRATTGGGRVTELRRAPAWLSGAIADANGAMPSLHWRCFLGKDRLGRSLWRKTGALLTEMERSFPSKRFYLKIDSDTILLPNALLAFLGALHALPSHHRPLYFGNNRIAQRRLFCSSRGCLFNSAAWRAAEAAVAANRSSSSSGGGGGGGGRLRTAPRAPLGCGAPPSYAQGGAYGFDRRAMAAFAGGGECLARAAAAVEAHTGSTELFEDEAVGLCMALHRVRLLTCRCFYDWGPCDIFHASSSCGADTNASRLCHLPLTVHKIRQLSWFDGWWKLLSAREPAALRAFNAWAASASAPAAHEPLAL